MRTPCPICGAVTELDHHAAGRTIRCGDCGKSFIAPVDLATKGRHHTLASFPVLVLLSLHYLTAGLFTLFHLNMMHDRMPKLRRDDPSSTVALGLCFVPIFNLYWLGWSCRRLCVRINEQRRLHGLPETAPTGLAMPTCLLFGIGLVAAFFSATAFYIWGLIGTLTMPIFAGWVQASVNNLCAHTPEDAPAVLTL
jgi:predicted Zn finger-like uncharacterized protein